MIWKLVDSLAISIFLEKRNFLYYREKEVQALGETIHSNLFKDLIVIEISGKVNI